MHSASQKLHFVIYLPRGLDLEIFRNENKSSESSVEMAIKGISDIGQRVARHRRVISPMKIACLSLKFPRRNCNLPSQNYF